MNTVINTIFGRAIINIDGYYQITSSKEGNYGKKLHRLIWENVWGNLPKGWIVHHLDGDETNNCILNLYGMPEHLHLSIHNKGKNHPMWGKKGKDNPRYGKTHSEETRRKISESRNRMGFFNVWKEKNKKCKQGVIYRYAYYDENNHRKRISSTDIKKLEEKVKSKGLKWLKFEDMGSD